VREVITGVEQDGFVEILEGIEVGEKVVVQGAFVLKSHLMRSELGHGHAH
jgi:cobalt-zinc-cadmium efflux system membrane fusion protein